MTASAEVLVTILVTNLRLIEFRSMVGLHFTFLECAKPEEAGHEYLAWVVLSQQGMDRVHHSNRSAVAADDDCHRPV